MEDIEASEPRRSAIEGGGGYDMCPLEQKPKCEGCFVGDAVLPISGTDKNHNMLVARLSRAGLDSSTMCYPGLGLESYVWLCNGMLEGESPKASENQIQEIADVFGSVALALEATAEAALTFDIDEDRYPETEGLIYWSINGWRKIKSIYVIKIK